MLTENKVFEKISFNEHSLVKGIFEECTFNNCDCSLTKLKSTILQDVRFVNSKLLGVQFHECNGFLLRLYFENCMLKLSVFYKLKLKNTAFKNCNLQEADFSEADLTGALFDNCDLLLATFMHTNLEKADFRSASHYSINPEINRIRKARFSIPGVTGLLTTYDIEIEW